MNKILKYVRSKLCWVYRSLRGDHRWFEWTATDWPSGKVHDRKQCTICDEHTSYTWPKPTMIILGKTISELRKMGRELEVKAEVMIKAFRDSARAGTFRWFK